MLLLSALKPLGFSGASPYSAYAAMRLTTLLLSSNPSLRTNPLAIPVNSEHLTTCNSRHAPRLGGPSKTIEAIIDLGSELESGIRKELPNQ
ncbi:MAG: hypothetical protein JOY62_17580 [Acidobacteriaceae bacterium]|nr:hypothetical protein [Acidobacteriaceae bacterium]MBV9781778.1 hypothetical protein [Acidobacteriaceae bacterium]